MVDIYTLDEVTRHNNEKDLWIVIHGVVYDITAFHKEHPGGEEVLLQLAGQDATECFESVGHSNEALNLRENFKIGEIVDGVINFDKSKPTTNTEVKESVEDKKWQYQEPEAETQSWNLKFICAVVAIYAILIFFWLNKQ